jgi:NADPH-dependent 2,4-dienoyl-CoA reductase/sulfur reductase-like enzyme/rhodanese-related sulfurtransferase
VSVGEARSIVIVGASAAGLKCACRLARLQPAWRVLVVDERSEFSYAACGLPYVLSGDIDDVGTLRRTQDGALRDPRYFARVKGVEVMTGWRALEISIGARTLALRDEKGSEREVVWDELVLACGAKPRRLPGQPEHPRVRSFHALEDVAPLHKGLVTGEIRSVAVVGAGLVGCELAEAFRSLWGASVTLIERAGWPLPELLDRETGAVVAGALESNGITTRFGAPVDGIRADGTVARVELAGDELAVDLVVVAVGVEPRVKLASPAGVALGTTGAIAVDERMGTSVPHVWAVGDCVEVRHAVTGQPAYLPLGSLANRQGRLLANVLAGRADLFPPVAGAMAVKVFECNVGAVGLTLSAAKRRGFDAAAVWLTSHDRAHYWPEAREFALQLVYDRGTRRVLGLQCVGAGEVAKRVDVAAQLIVRGASLAELSHVEHAYAPPYAPVMEPLAVAAFVARNQEEGIAAASPLDNTSVARVLDVRHPEERRLNEVGGDGTVSVPIEELRDRELDVGEGPILVVCERGGRSAEVVRWLQRRGAGARYLGGGLRWLGVGRSGSSA